MSHKQCLDGAAQLFGGDDSLVSKISDHSSVRQDFTGWSLILGDAERQSWRTQAAALPRGDATGTDDQIDVQLRQRRVAEGLQRPAAELDRADTETHGLDLISMKKLWFWRHLHPNLVLDQVLLGYHNGS